MNTYMATARTLAIRTPPNPPPANPKFQEKYSPEMTSPTPSPHIRPTPARRSSARCSMYCRPTCSYSTTPTFSTLGFSSTSPPSRRLDGETTGRPLSDQNPDAGERMPARFPPSSRPLVVSTRSLSDKDRARRGWLGHEDEGKKGAVVLRPGGAGPANGHREDAAGVSTSP